MKEFRIEDDGQFEDFLTLVRAELEDAPESGANPFHLKPTSRLVVEPVAPLRVEELNFDE